MASSWAYINACLKSGDLVGASQNIPFTAVPNYPAIIAATIHTTAVPGNLLGMVPTHRKMEKKALGMQDNSDLQCN